MYYDKQDEIDNLFYEYHVPLLNNLDPRAFIEEWKQNIDAAPYENFNKGIKLPSNKKKLIVMISLITVQQS